MTASLTITENLSVVVSEESRKIVRTVENKAGSIRVSFVPVSAKTGVSLKSLGYKGSAAKAVIRKAKREIGSAIVGAMATAVSSGKLDWRSAVLSKTGTLGIFFSQGEGADAGELSKAEERAKSAESKLEALKKALLAKGCSEDEIQATLGV
jgi:hypothetical protein